MEIDPRSLLYGPRRIPRAPSPQLERVASGAPGSNAFACLRDGQLRWALVEDNLIQAGLSSRPVSFGWERPRGTFPRQYLYARDGEHFLCCSGPEGSRCLSFSPAPVRAGKLSSCSSLARLAESDGEIHAVWSVARNQTLSSDKDSARLLSLNAELLSPEGPCSRVVLDLTFGSYPGTPATGGGWTAWSYLNRYGSWEISAVRLGRKNPGTDRLTFLCSERPMNLAVDDMEGHPCFCWTGSESLQIHFREGDSQWLLGRGYAQWTLLGKEGAAFAWTDDGRLRLARKCVDGRIEHLDPGPAQVRSGAGSLEISAGSGGDPVVVWVDRKSESLRSYPLAGKSPAPIREIRGPWRGRIDLIAADRYSAAGVFALSSRSSTQTSIWKVRP